MVWYHGAFEEPAGSKGIRFEIKTSSSNISGNPKDFLLVFTLVNYMLRYIELVNRGLDRGLTYTVNLEV